jgi:hypothetical protein
MSAPELGGSSYSGGKTVLPKVSIGHRCGALLANIENYRLLMSDELFEEVVELARGLLPDVCLLPRTRCRCV